MSLLSAYQRVAMAAQSYSFVCEYCRRQWAGTDNECPSCGAHAETERMDNDPYSRLNYTVMCHSTHGGIPFERPEPVQPEITWR